MNLSGEIRRCHSCSLREKCKAPVPGRGLEYQPGGLMVVGEAPGETEDACGKPFVGKAGEVLTEMIHSLSLRRKDFYITNAVKCYPLGNLPSTTPKMTDIRACHFWIEREIEEYKPKVILCLGNVAIWSVMGDNKLRVSTIHGRRLRGPGNIPVIATFHPSYLMRSGAAASSGRDPGLSIKQALEDIRIAYDLSKEDKIIEVPHIAKEIAIWNYTRGMAPLEGKFIGFDLEWKGNEPFHEGAEVLCGSISCGNDVVFFPTHMLKYFVRYWLACRGLKTGHAISNDLCWMLWLLCKDDDEREELLSCNELCDGMILLGLYDHRIEPKTLKHASERYAKKKTMERPFGGRTGKTIDDVPPMVIRKYNCCDSVSGVGVARYFLRHLKDQQRTLGMWLCFDVLPATIRASWNGIFLDQKRLTDLTRQIEAQLRKAEKRLGRIAPDVDLSSKGQILDHVFGTLQMPVVKWAKKARWAKKSKPKWATGARKPCFNKEVKLELQKADSTHFVKWLSRREKLTKRLKTYAVKFRSMLAPDGAVHPRFILVRQEYTSADQDTRDFAGGAVTGRPTMRGFPFQTMGREDPLRSCIVSRFGSSGCIGWWDYSQIELRVAADLACAEVMLEIFEQEKYDIHTMTASDLLEKPYDQITKHERQVFGKTPNFSIIFGCTADKLVELFAKEGVTLRHSFAEKMRRRWYKRYTGFEEYQEKVRQLVLKQGYVTTPTGRIEYIHASNETKEGRKGFRQAINAGIQGGAADICTAGFAKLSRLFAEKPYARRVLLFGTVYDAIVGDFRKSVVAKADALGQEVLVDTKSLVGPLGWEMQCPVKVEFTSGRSYQKES